METVLKMVENLPDRSKLNVVCKEKGYAIYILDDFSAHLGEEVKMAFLKKGYILVIIGGGITGEHIDYF